MKVLFLSFISFLIILKVFAVEYSDPTAVPESVWNDILKLDSTSISEVVADTLFSADYNEYWLYTSENPTEGHRLVYQDEESVKSSYFDINKCTIFIIHGWTGHRNNQLNENVTTAVLTSSDRYKYNIIRCDWSKYAKLDYLSASAAVSNVGELICKFIKFLETLGLKLAKTILLGFSLGAHVAGFAGRACNCIIDRIIALDPAGPRWKYDPKKLSKKDAFFVEVTHTSDRLGDYSLIGHADYYPNGGKHMESCSDLDFFCNHKMAPRYWCASWILPNEYLANQCSSMDEMEQNKCSGKVAPYGRNNIHGQEIDIFRFNTTIPYEPFMKEA